MSRVDDAMRRAAEEAQKKSLADAASPRPSVNNDPAVLAREPFPVEMPGSTATPSEEPQMSGSRPHVPTSNPTVSRTRETRKDRPAPSDHSRPLQQFDAKLAEKLVLDERMMSVAREQYRRLAGILHDAQEARGLRVVMVASAVGGEGKTLTASNLALTFSESYRKRVLLIDADLRRPALHQVFRITASSGLGEGLDPTSESKLVVRQVLPNLAVLPAGRPIPDPMARLISERMRRLIDEARETFDWVIIDAPPLMLLPDANLLASMVDGTVLIIQAASTRHHLAKRALDTIGRDRIVGVVLNQAAAAPAGSSDEYYQYYADAPAPALPRP